MPSLTWIVRMHLLIQLGRRAIESLRHHLTCYFSETNDDLGGQTNANSWFKVLSQKLNIFVDFGFCCNV